MGTRLGGLLASLSGNSKLYHKNFSLNNIEELHLTTKFNSRSKFGGDTHGDINL